MRTSQARLLPAFVSALLLFAVAAHGTGTSGRAEGSSPASDARLSPVSPKPGGGSYFRDPHRRGRASEVRIVELSWGRLVDVHDLDAAGEPGALPVYRDVVVREDVQSDGRDYLLETNPLTLATRLVILRRGGGERFHDLLQRATSGLPTILPKHDDGSSPPPFSTIARNATLVIRCSDLLRDDRDARLALASGILFGLSTGTPPDVPFAPRILFDPNHGGVVSGRFHSTRILVDMTVSAMEAANSPAARPINLLGLPAGPLGASSPSVSLRIPTQVDPASGQYELLTNLSGAPLATVGNGPVDLGSPTKDVVRAMRAGNENDSTNGFLLDLDPPELVGSWPLVVSDIGQAPNGLPGFDFLADLSFAGGCAADLEVDDVLSANGEFLVVIARGAPLVPATGMIGDIRLRLQGQEPLADPSVLLGAAVAHAAFAPNTVVPPACWLSFQPLPGGGPGTGVDPASTIGVRFSEPMDPATVLPFDTYLLVRGDASQAPTATSIVVGTIQSSGDLVEHELVPLLPLAHAAGMADPYHVRLLSGAGGPRDLAGNPLLQAPGPIELTLDPNALEEANAGIVLRFGEVDEYQVGPAAGADDLRGQFFYDLGAERIRPRPVVRTTEAVDRNQPVPGLMVPFPYPLQTPLTPLGSKLHTVWRYCDFGWLADDESRFNLDVEGMSWSPYGGQVVSDSFPEFEMRLAHGSRLPDEFIDHNLLPLHPSSGLYGPPHPFADNVLDDPESPQKVVHAKQLGYHIDPSDLFFVGNTPLMPYPMNREGGPWLTYTWRDTAVQSRAGSDGAGMPLQREAELPLQLYGPGFHGGELAAPGSVPSIGLPLLTELRCYPSDTAIGLNGYDTSLAINSSAFPSFRSFSAGGFNTLGFAVTVDPDLEVVPSGGFNPGSTPPGQPTPAVDNVFHLGAVDFVTRVSRVHSVWFDTQSPSPDFFTPLTEPSAVQQPAGTQVELHYRGASAFIGTNGSEADASTLDAYGDVPVGTVVFQNGQEAWSNDIDSVDGARFVQVRLTFLNEIATGFTADLSSLGIAFQD